jgi:HipA-like protein
MSDVDGLDVYMHGVIAGILERRSQARLRFTYGEDWVAGEQPPLSLSLPVPLSALRPRRMRLVAG